MIFLSDKNSKLCENWWEDFIPDPYVNPRRFRDSHFIDSIELPSYVL